MLGRGGLRHGGAPFTAMNWDFKQHGGCFSPSPRAQTGQGHGERVKMARGARLMGVRAVLPHAGPAGGSRQGLPLAPSRLSLCSVPRSWLGWELSEPGACLSASACCSPGEGATGRAAAAGTQATSPRQVGAPPAPQHPAGHPGIPAAGSVSDEDIRARWVKAREPSPLCTHSVISVNYAQT